MEAGMKKAKSKAPPSQNRGQGTPSMTASALSRDTKSVRAARARFFLFFPERIFSLSCISTKARFVNLAVESGSTNHLFGLP